jgi:hypothetical protein
MDHLNTALKFSAWSLEALSLPPLLFVLILSAISLVWAGLKQRPFKTGRWKTNHWFVVSHLLFFVSAIAVAVFGVNPNTNPTIPHPPIPAAELCLDIVTYGSIASCGFWIWRMKGFRWYAASLLLVAEVVVWGALSIAGMSVSGDWL